MTIGLTPENQHDEGRAAGSKGQRGKQTPSRQAAYGRFLFSARTVSQITMPITANVEAKTMTNVLVSRALIPASHSAKSGQMPALAAAAYRAGAQTARPIC